MTFQPISILFSQYLSGVGCWSTRRQVCGGAVLWNSQPASEVGKYQELYPLSPQLVPADTS